MTAMDTIDPKDTAKLRRVQRVSATHWVVQCKVCPKRGGRKEVSTEEAVRAWWHWHRADSQHVRALELHNAGRDPRAGAEDPEEHAAANPKTLQPRL